MAQWYDGMDAEDEMLKEWLACLPRGHVVGDRHYKFLSESCKRDDMSQRCLKLS
jgi:hypothetical protein